MIDLKFIKNTEFNIILKYLNEVFHWEIIKSDYIKCKLHLYTRRFMSDYIEYKIKYNNKEINLFVNLKSKTIEFDVWLSDYNNYSVSVPINDFYIYIIKKKREKNLNYLLYICEK